ncbi:hypothetical protein ACIFOT_04685 [Neobacillus sp. NRS-1170]|uniref:hypothetical protein n=1 Tax=Neobacillus sp. NRS-1170 TaxID=3233898 RepID=UPI003D2C2C64
MNELLGVKHIVKSEETVKEFTRNYLKGIHDNIPKIMDVFFKLGHFFGKTADVETYEGAAQSICKLQYLQSPYSFWSIYNQFEKGYYLEAQVLYRHVLEAFIQMRYFHKYPSKLIDHINGSKRINFSVMFNEFSPGFYKLYYRKHISEAVHGLAIKDFYRVDRLNNRTIMGLEFNVDVASSIINQFIPLLFGFLNGFTLFFPQNTLSLNQEVTNNFTNSQEWLEYAMKSHKKANPNSLIWSNHMKELVTFI